MKLPFKEDRVIKNVLGCAMTVVTTFMVVFVWFPALISGTGPEMLLGVLVFLVYIIQLIYLFRFFRSNNRSKEKV